MTTITASRTTRAVLTSVAAGAVVTANFAPFPYLGPAVSVVVGILKLCENVRTNKREIIDLGSRCEALLCAIRDSIDPQVQTPDRINAVVMAASSLLEDIHQKMTAWLSSSRLKQFVYQDDIAEDVQRCHQGIDSFIASFQITSHMEIHNWMIGFEKNRKLDQEETLSQLADIKNQNEIMMEAQTIHNAQMLQFMAFMQNGLAAFQQGDFRHTGLSRTLLSVQNQSGNLLPGIELNHGEVRRIGKHPVGGSAAFDIWEGEYLSGAKCAIKVVRGIEVSPKVRERFLREIKIWREMYAKDVDGYILPFWGACLDDGPYPYMVSPWMQYGESTNFLKKYPDANRKKIIYRIAQALQFLHSQDPPIAHGDMKGANVLINEKCEPVLADFSLSKIMAEVTGMPFTQSRGISDSYRWFAPELCNADGNLSPAADVFAYAMTVLELMTDAPPFRNVKRTPQVLVEMQRGARPGRPWVVEVNAGRGVGVGMGMGMGMGMNGNGGVGVNGSTGRVDEVERAKMAERGLDERMWGVLERCWAQEAASRPTMAQVLQELPAQ